MTDRLQAGAGSQPQPSHLYRLRGSSKAAQTGSVVRSNRCGVDENGHVSDALLAPARLWTRAEVLTRPSPVPAEPGVYAWYFTTVPPGVPTEGCRSVDGAVLLYAGISPKRPPANGSAPSAQTLRNRVRYHFRGNAAGSTLRLTLGVLLAEQLNIELRRVGSTGNRLTFSAGEAALNKWMAEHARVCWRLIRSPGSRSRS